jgi:hypothetical protein
VMLLELLVALAPQSFDHSVFIDTTFLELVWCFSLRYNCMVKIAWCSANFAFNVDGCNQKVPLWCIRLDQFEDDVFPFQFWRKSSRRTFSRIQSVWMLFTATALGFCDRYEILKKTVLMWDYHTFEMSSESHSERNSFETIFWTKFVQTIFEPFLEQICACEPFRDSDVFRSWRPSFMEFDRFPIFVMRKTVCNSFRTFTSHGAGVFTA